MFKNYFKIAFRSLWKNKGFTAINIIGLAVGLATCLLIIFYVLDELGYDKYNEHADRIFRLDADIQFGGTNFVMAVSPDPIGPTMAKDYPQVEKAARLFFSGGFRVKKGNENVRENRIVYADSTLFDVFTLPMIQGDPKTALIDPHSVVITETTAKKYFNRTDVIGQNIIMNDTINYKITGVIKDVPSQSHFNFNFFLSLSTLEYSRENNWLSNNFNTYVLLREGVDPKFIESRFPEMIRKYLGPQAQQLLHASLDDLAKSGGHVIYTLTPLTKIHLHSGKVGELGTNSSIEYVYIFSAIAIFILLIACVNFMNLSTARSSGRAREVGVRKVLGSLRSNLIIQFLTESTLISFISLLFALVIAWLLLPYFNQLAGKEISMRLLLSPLLLPALLLLIVMVGLLAGSYPAFYLSAFKPIQVLKGKVASGFKRSWFRSGLVVFQFWISIILIIGTMVIYKQLSYIQNKKLGFDREHVLVIHNAYPLGSQAKAFKEDILKLPGVESATMTGYLPTSESRSDNPFFLDANLDQKRAISVQTWLVDENYVSTLKMEMDKGRNFSKEFITDSNAVILNEAAARLMNVPNPLNVRIYMLDDYKTKSVKEYNIIGIVKDFNFNSLRQPVTPMALFLKDQKGDIAFRINTANIPGLISQVESKWRQMAANQPFSYSFMDDDFNSIYRSEQRMGKISVSFAVLAILIACLGLFGLAAYAAEQRVKEIGIRKVLGATISNIVSMLSTDFLKLVIISALIAFPVAWWMMSKWLQDFAYRVTISWWVFALAGVLAVAIALITVCFQAIKAALMNPVKSLRTE